MTWTGGAHVQVEAQWERQQLGRQGEAPEEGSGGEEGGGFGGDADGLQEEVPGAGSGHAGVSRHDATEL